MMWKRMMMIHGKAACSPEIFPEPTYKSSVVNYVAHMPTSCRAWFYLDPIEVEEKPAIKNSSDESSNSANPGSIHKEHRGLSSCNLQGVCATS